MNYYYPSAYDAASLLLGAIEKVAIPEPDGRLHIGRYSLRKALYATSNFKGVTGELTCDKFGDCSRPAFNILRILQAALDNSQAGILIADAKTGNIQYINEVGLHIMGESRETIPDDFNIFTYVRKFQGYDFDGNPIKREGEFLR